MCGVATRRSGFGEVVLGLRAEKRQRTAALRERKLASGASTQAMDMEVLPKSYSHTTSNLTSRLCVSNSAGRKFPGLERCYVEIVEFPVVSRAAANV